MRDEWEMAFQSRFGRAEWLQPYLAQRLTELPGEGVQDLTVVCPGFAVDCVETLEEIAIEGRSSFLGAGGKRFEYVPALNDQSSHVQLQLQRILQHASGWPETENNPELKQQQPPLDTRSLAIAAGAKQ